MIPGKRPSAMRRTGSSSMQDCHRRLGGCYWNNPARPVELPLQLPQPPKPGCAECSAWISPIYFVSFFSVIRFTSDRSHSLGFRLTPSARLHRR